jgi:hypothetical protein
MILNIKDPNVEAVEIEGPGRIGENQLRRHEIITELVVSLDT